jgi:hypothetical protein
MSALACPSTPLPRAFTACSLHNPAFAARGLLGRDHPTAGVRRSAACATAALSSPRREMPRPPPGALNLTRKEPTHASHMLHSARLRPAMPTAR